MFYAFNENKNRYRYGSNRREITEKSLNDNIKADIGDWKVIELNEDIVTVNGKQFVRSSVPAAEIIAEKAAKVRSVRNGLLARSDWTQAVDCPLAPEKKELWAKYRQSLRDVTAQISFPASVVFPPIPE